MAEPFITVKMLVQRADQQIANLRERINAFSNGNSWTHIVEKDTDGVTDIHKLRFPKNPAVEWTHIVFETVNNLRTALDQIAFNVAVLCGKANAKAAKFPFGPTEADMLNNLSGGCKDLPAEIQALFRSFHPYKGGNNTLWALNELVNTNKHKILLPVGLTSVNINIPDAVTAGAFAVNYHGWDRAKNEITLLKVAPGGQHLKYDAHITTTIAIDHVDEVIRGQPPVALLEVILSEVQRVGWATEAECRRIGLIP